MFPKSPQGPLRRPVSRGFLLFRGGRKPRKEPVRGFLSFSVNRISRPYEGLKACSVCPKDCFGRPSPRTGFFSALFPRTFRALSALFPLCLSYHYISHFSSSWRSWSANLARDLLSRPLLRRMDSLSMLPTETRRSYAGLSLEPLTTFTFRSGR